MSKLTLQLAMNPMEVSSGHIQSSEISTDRYFVARGFPITTEGHEEEKEFARRIVACVNACEGVPTETLECEIFNHGLLKLSSTANEFARLKSKLKALEDAYSEGNISRLVSERMDAKDNAVRLIEILKQCEPYMHDLNAENFNDCNAGINEDTDLSQAYRNLKMAIEGITEQDISDTLPDEPIFK